ncbi:hypothetical protein BDZ91DRAFT_721010 [Kalaharituber pfeilii]|nr:hypothetical protein BDZ91DRAFT_721010 [Kalaharituber pfeilii]
MANSCKRVSLSCYNQRLSLSGYGPWFIFKTQASSAPSRLNLSSPPRSPDAAPIYPLQDTASYSTS